MLRLTISGIFLFGCGALALGAISISSAAPNVLLLLLAVLCAWPLAVASVAVSAVLFFSQYRIEPVNRETARAQHQRAHDEAYRRPVKS